MPQYRCLITMAATTKAQAEADLKAMTAAHTNKTVQMLTIEDWTL